MASFFLVSFENKSFIYFFQTGLLIELILNHGKFDYFWN